MAYDATFHKSARQLEEEGPAFGYTAENRARFEEIVKRYPPERARRPVLPALCPRPHQRATFTVLEVECLGACDRAPVVMVNDAWHENLQPEAAAKLIDDLRARGEAALSGCHHVVERRKDERTGD